MKETHTASDETAGSENNIKKHFKMKIYKIAE